MQFSEKRKVTNKQCTEVNNALHYSLLMVYKCLNQRHRRVWMWHLSSLLWLWLIFCNRGLVVHDCFITGSVKGKKYAY